VQVPKFWKCEGVEDWQPKKRSRRWAKKCNLPYGPEAQAAWERNPIGKGW
jgi:hypothetical protein